MKKNKQMEKLKSMGTLVGAALAFLVIAVISQMDKAWLLPALGVGGVLGLIVIMILVR